MATATQKRQKVIDSYNIILGRNIYSQDGTLRECVFDKYKDGKHYSDCSSSIRRAYRRADIGLPNIGGNTVGMYQNKALVTVKCAIKNGIPTDISALRQGDMLLYAGTDKNRAYADFVGHIEMIHTIKNNVVTLCGHGSGNPSKKNMVDYCKSRQNASAPTSKGNRGLLKVVRAIPDDGEPTTTPPKPEPEFGSVTLKKGMKAPDAHVKRLQLLLIDWGFSCGSYGADGDFGSDTEKAVKNWQKKHGLTADGIINADDFAMIAKLSGAKIEIKITGGDCHVRTGAGTEHKSIGVLKDGSIVPASGKEAEGWIGVVFEGKDAFVSSKYGKMQ